MIEKRCVLLWCCIVCAIVVLVYANVMTINDNRAELGNYLNCMESADNTEDFELRRTYEKMCETIEKSYWWKI